MSLNNKFERENGIALQKLVYDVAFKKQKKKMKPLMFKIIKIRAIFFWYANQQLLGFCK